MENLPQLYHDVRIAKLQLEYLLEIARAALQPWPKRDSHGQAVHAQNKQLDTEDISGSHALLLDKEDDEMSVKVLDEILTKAQTARDVSKRHRKVNTIKMLAPYMESSRTAVQARKPAAKMGGAKSMNKSEMIDQFTVEKHGNKMTLPNKWSRLRTAIDKLADDKMEPASKMEGDHFVQLLRQQGGSNPDVNSLLITRVTIDAMTDDVMCVPMEQWSMNSRNSWQALYRIKHHIDLIQQSMVVLRKQIDDTSRSGLSLTHSITHQSSPRCLTYSSDKELLDYIESYTTSQLQLFQLRISQLCQHFLPTVCDSSMATSDAVTSTNIRNMYSLVGLKHSPIFVHVTNNNS